MNKTVKRIIQFALLLGVILAAALLTGCSGGDDVDTSGMYLVVYDGNGGYLGNKTATKRMLYCQPNSKIPNYPLDYSTTEYVVSSLGLAMRSGYNLKGWYTSADYTEKEDGQCILLSLKDGCGVYEEIITEEQEEAAKDVYVQDYVEDPEGKYIRVHMEENPNPAEENNNRYVLIIPQFDEENNPIPLPIEPGFYICNDENDFAKEHKDSEELLKAYIEAFGRKKYTAKEATDLSGAQYFEDLNETNRKLFADFQRYEYKLIPYDENNELHSHLTRYALVDGYALLDDLFVENPVGSFISLPGHNYEKANREEQPEDTKFYSVSPRFVFKGDTTLGLTRYEMKVDYWSFNDNRVTEDVCTWDGSKYVLYLYALWEKKLTVNFYYNNGTNQFNTMTTRLLEDQHTTVDLQHGDFIRYEYIPPYAGHTFVGWSKSPKEYDPWDFKTDVFPEDDSELNLYAYYIEGTYKRINSVKGLEGIKDDISNNVLSGKYLIVEDIDLGGKEYTGSLFGNNENTVFTGELLSYGKTISNFSLKLAHMKNNSSATLAGAIFPKSRGGKISGLNVDFTVICNKYSGRVSTVNVFKMNCAGLIGEVLNGDQTVVSGCNIKLTVQPATEKEFNIGEFDYEVTVGDIAAKGTALTVTDCTAILNTEKMTGSCLKMSINRLAGQPEEN